VFPNPIGWNHVTWTSTYRDVTITHVDRSTMMSSHWRHKIYTTNQAGDLSRPKLHYIWRKMVDPMTIWNTEWLHKENIALLSGNMNFSLPQKYDVSVGLTTVRVILVLPLTIGSLIMQLGIATYCPLTWRTDLDLSFFSCITKGMGWPCHWTGGLKVTCERSLKGRAKSLSDCSLAYTDKQFAFCEPCQKNMWTVPVQ
jgi:hypothetical protein